jgi:hypothetical protein
MHKINASFTVPVANVLATVTIFEFGFKLSSINATIQGLGPEAHQLQQLHMFAPQLLLGTLYLRNLSVED